MKNLFLILFTGLFLLNIENISAQQVQVCDLPACYSVSTYFQISLNGTNVPVSTTFGVYEYAHFSFSGTINLTVTVQNDITSFNISPLSYEIEGTANGKSLSFQLNQSRYLILKINNLPELIIAADNLETDIPASSGTGIYNIVSDYNADMSGNNTSDAVNQNTSAIQQAINAANTAGGGIVYIPAGVYYCKNIVLKSHVHIYLEAGAVIRGTGKKADYVEHYRKVSISNYPGSWFLYTDTPIPLPAETNRSLPVEQTTGIKIYGRGTIDGNGDAARKNGLLMALLMPMNTENMTVDGVIFRDSGLWGVTPTRSNDIQFINTKHFNENNNDHEDDAVDVQESQRVLFRHSIAVSEDDTYSTKTWENWSGDITKNWSGPAENLDDVVFDDCVAWSRCATFKVGFGVHQHQSNITFRNSVSYKSMRAIAVNHKYKPKNVTNVLFENMDIEGYWPRSGNGQRWFEADFAESSNGGTIDGLTLRNINVRNAGANTSILKGLNMDTQIKNITFENIYMPGKDRPATTLGEMNIKERNSYLENIIILPEIPDEPLTSIHSINDFIAIRNYLNGNFQLEEDIDLSEWIAEYSPENGWEPIGTANNPFTGQLNGNGHTIRGLWSKNSTIDNVGLFGVADGKVNISRLAVIVPEDKSIQGKNNTGALIGYCISGELSISEVFINGKIESLQKNAGALVGYSGAQTQIKDCYVIGTVYAPSDRAGGLLGLAENTSLLIQTSYAVNEIRSNSGSAGGLVASVNGSGSDLGILKCVAANPKVSGSASYTGRIWGYNAAGNNRLENIAFDGMGCNSSEKTQTLSNKNGWSSSRSQILNENVYKSDFAWDFNSIWSMGNEHYPLPVLQSISLDDQPETLPVHLQESNFLREIGQENDGEICIFDLTGKKILQIQAFESSIERLPAGIYLVKTAGKIWKWMKI
ncbi:MAG: hypothetical protein LBS25_01530 [Candidatus Symbiothrix sp.]|jgi:hypothetical protein|nr:hypothetical protein [Candidatus Symbiothrix sp.]